MSGSLMGALISLQLMGNIVNVFNTKLFLHFWLFVFLAISLLWVSLAKLWGLCTNKAKHQISFFEYIDQDFDNLKS
jgi:hypothetical protein